MNNYITQIDNRLRALLALCKEPKLKEVMEYSALGPGKRMRPQLLLATCEALAGGYSETVLDFACAIEMIHAYSLAHDDLPAMDNDDFRRGRLTCHKAFTEGLAILAGDGLLSLAVEVMASHICGEKSIQSAQALRAVMRGAGTNGMVAGQMSDILHEGHPIDAETLAAIHSRKTGGLITACLEAGAILASASEPTITKMINLGALLGLAFQIKDDILDVTSTQESLGKPIGSDAKNQKSTYVSVHGLDFAQAKYANLSTEISETLSDIPQKTNALQDMTTAILARAK